MAWIESIPAEKFAASREIGWGLSGTAMENPGRTEKITKMIAQGWW